MRVLVLHGPNMNLLGEREPGVYGRATLEEIDARIGERGRHLGAEVRTFQSNHEGALIDRLHAERRWADGVLFNPGALTHYAWALRDAVAAVSLPCIEVHLSDVSKREPWRHLSVLADVRAALCAGRGLDSYLEALELLLEIAPGPERDAEETVALLAERLAHPDERERAGARAGADHPPLGPIPLGGPLRRRARRGGSAWAGRDPARRRIRDFR